MKKYLKVALKIFLWLIGFVFFLILVVFFVIQIPKVQNYIADRGTKFLATKTKSVVRLRDLRIRFPKTIVLSGLYMETPERDTLLYAGELRINVSLTDLLSKKITVNLLSIDSLTANVSRSMPDSTFNFNYIIKAFDSGKPAAPKDTTNQAEPWNIGVETIRLTHINASYIDAVTGMDTKIILGELKTDFKTFNLNKQKIIVDELLLKGTSAYYKQSKEILKDSVIKPYAPILFDFGIDKITLANVDVTYENTIDGIKTGIKLGDARIIADEINLNKELIKLNEFTLKNTTAFFEQQKKADEVKVEKAVEEAVTAITENKPNWKVSLDKLGLENINLLMNNFNSAPTKGLDFNRLAIRNLDFSVQDIQYSASSTKAIITHLSAVEKSGFEIKELKADLVYDSTHAEIANLNFQTGNSIFTKYVSLSYPNIASLSSNIAEAAINADLPNVKIGLQDVLYFAPDLIKNPSLNRNKNEKINLSAKVNGKVKDLTIEYLNVDLLGNTILKSSGTIKGLPDAQKSYFNLTIDELRTTRSAIFQLAKEQIPASITIPEQIALTAKYTGTLSNFNAKTAINTSLGGITADVQMRGMQSKLPVYTLNTNLKNLNAGVLLKQPSTLGRFTGNANVTGKGLSAETIRAKVAVLLNNADLNGYEYRGLAINGDINRKSFIGKISIDDRDVAFVIDADLNMNKQIPEYGMVLDLKAADLKALKLGDKDFKVKGIITANFSGTDINTINGKLDMKKVVMVTNNKTYFIDSLLAASLNEEGKSELSLQAPFVDIKFEGNFGIANLAKAINQHIDRYFNLDGIISNEKIPLQRFSFAVKVKDPTMLTEIFVPGLTKLTPGEISGRFNSDSAILITKVDIPQIVYNDIQIDSLNININSDPDSLIYKLGYNNLKTGDIKIYRTAVNGSINNEILSTKIQIDRADTVGMYIMAGQLKSINNNFRFSLSPSQVLNFENWMVPEDNYIQFGKAGLIASNLKLENNNQFLLIDSKDKSSNNSPLLIDFENFELTTFSKILEQDSSLFRGQLNGDVELKNLQTKPGFLADLEIKDFSFKSDTLGTIKVNANNEEEDKYAVKVDIIGNENDVAIKGIYNANDSLNALNFNLELANLNLESIEPFTFGNVRDMSGNLTGEMKISGSTSSPRLNGKLNLVNANFTPTIINTPLFAENETININSEGVTFKDFTLSDDLKSQAILNGSVKTKDFTNFVLNLNLKTDNFLALNTTKKENELYYGTVFIDSDIDITGNQDKPMINVKAKMNEGSNFTYALPTNQETIQESEGVVVFINSDTTLNPIMTRKDKSKTVVDSVLKGFELYANIEIDPETRVKIVIDPVTEDSLVIKGNGTMSLGIDPSGKVSLVGVYEINEGSYKLSFQNFVKRVFEIQPGSTINWTGDPTTGTADITALYRVRTSPLELVSSQFGGSPEELNAYKQKLPFEVVLNMDGNLLTPDISFDIRLPIEDQGALGGAVDAKLNVLRQDPSDLNKQVFALLVLRRFIADNPLENNSGSDVFSSTARTTVSRLLSQQLNSFTEQYLRGVTLNLELDSYNDFTETGESEGRTELQVGASKSILEDRVVVSVGGNVDVEGERAKNTSLNDFASDIIVEYKLTPDGRYRAKAYRENQYEGLLEGELTETGIGLTYIRDFNSTKELFKRPEKEVIEEAKKQRALNKQRKLLERKKRKDEKR